MFSIKKKKKKKERKQNLKADKIIGGCLNRDLKMFNSFFIY